MTIFFITKFHSFNFVICFLFWKNTKVITNFTIKKTYKQCSNECCTVPRSQDPYRSWAQVQWNSPIALNPSWNCLHKKRVLGLESRDALDIVPPEQSYKPYSGKSWDARGTPLPSRFAWTGTKFQGHNCYILLSPKHPLKTDNIGPSIALAVAIIMISPLT